MGVPHAGVFVLDNFPAALDPHFLLAVLNGPLFWSFVRGTMPTMGEGRHVLRRGPLAGFRVPLASEAAQFEIAALVKQLMVVKTASERDRLKHLIDDVVIGCAGIATRVVQPPFILTAEAAGV
jgi:hypothetical protein